MKALSFLVSIIATVAFIGCGAQSSATSASTAALPPIRVTTATVEASAHRSMEPLSGTVKAATAVTLMARLPGLVARINATPGTTVAAGAVLVELDAQEIVAKRNQAHAAVTTAQAAVAEATAIAAEAAATHTLANLDWARAKQLVEKAAITPAEYDGAEAKAKAAVARVAASNAMINAATSRVTAAEAAEAEAAVMISYTTISAPIAGVVVRKLVEVGDLLSPGRPVIELEDPTSLRLEVAVPESSAAALPLKAEVAVSIPAADYAHTATVVEVTPAADPISRTVLVKLALPEATPTLRSGQFGRVMVTISGGTDLTVPSTAVIRRGQLDGVFVIAQGVAHFRLVRLGESESDVKRIAIRAGLVAGDTVVMEGVERVSDGQGVILAPTP